MSDLIKEMAHKADTNVENAEGAYFGHKADDADKPGPEISGYFQVINFQMVLIDQIANC